MINLDETDDWIGTAWRTEEPAEGSSISGPQLPAPEESQNLIFGYEWPLPVADR